MSKEDPTGRDPDPDCTGSCVHIDFTGGTGKLGLLAKKPNGQVIEVSGSVAQQLLNAGAKASTGALAQIVAGSEAAYMMPVKSEDLPADSQQAHQSSQTPNYVKAFGDVVAKAEGGAYNKKYGGGTFSDYSKFPDYDSGPTASGRYQINKPTYDDLNKSMKLSGFGPDVQDSMFSRLLTRDGAMTPLSQGDFAGAVSHASRTWAALPQGPGLPNRYPPQPYMNYNDALSYFNERLAPPVQ